jgi:hypothetical protein
MLPLNPSLYPFDVMISKPGHLKAFLFKDLIDGINHLLKPIFFFIVHISNPLNIIIISRFLERHKIPSQL